jgi:hypothetical protein
MDLTKKTELIKELNQLDDIQKEFLVTVDFDELKNEFVKLVEKIDENRDKQEYKIEECKVNHLIDHHLNKKKIKSKFNIKMRL